MPQLDLTTSAERPAVPCSAAPGPIYPPIPAPTSQMKTVNPRGLIFDGALVPGVMSGAITVTARIMRPQPDQVTLGNPYWHVGGYRLSRDADNPMRCPFRVGERRHICEAWYSDARGGLLGYPADGDCPHGESYRIGRAQHMPREHARAWVEIVSVRPARCQDITEGEIRASLETRGSHQFTLYRMYGRCSTDWTSEPRDSYQSLWECLNSRKGFPWSGNCWTWRVTLKLTEKPC